MKWCEGRKGDKQRRRAARERGRRRDRDSLFFAVPSAEELLRAIRRVDLDMPWEEVADDLLPVFRRRRPYPEAGPPMLYLRRPPGLDVGVAVDIGPALMHPDASRLAAWGLTPEEALAQAIANVRRRATSDSLEPVCDGDIAGVPTRFFQTGLSIGSGLLLTPDLLATWFGDWEQFILAPARDLLVSVPIAAGIRFAAELYESIAEEDPNCLDLPVLVLRGGSLELAVPEESGATMVH